MKNILNFIESIINNIITKSRNNIEHTVIIDDKLYTVEETANILRCKVGTIYTWKYQKRLKSNKAGGKFLFLGSEIKAFIGS